MIDEFASDFWWISPVIAVIVLLFAGCLAYIYIRAPILYYRGYRIPHPMSIRYFGGIAELPGLAQCYFENAMKPLAELGFEPFAVCQYAPDNPTNVKTFSAFLFRPESLDGAVLTCTFVEADESKEMLVDESVGFGTRFRDGMLVETYNGTFLSPFRDLPNWRMIQFSDCYDSGELYRRHQENCNRMNQGPRMWRLAEEFDGKVDDYLQANLQEQYEYTVRCGHLRRDDGEYRPTIYGACVFAWQELPPWRQLRAYAVRKRANRWLQVLGQA